MSSSEKNKDTSCFCMGGFFRYKQNQPVNWFNRSPSKSNQHCLYCGRFVGEGADIESNKEHLIGRDFVPTGEFDNGRAFNFIFRACKRCNDEKAEAERHLSAVTLYRSPARKEAEKYNEIAHRKGKRDYHPDKRGTLLQDSGDNFDVVANGFGLKMTFGIKSPPQASPDYIDFLAFKHVQGLCSLILTTNPLNAEETRLLSYECFHLFGSFSHADWGNSHMLAIIERTKEMPCVLNVSTANAFFRAILCVDRENTGEWFWALEWNKHLRIVGAISPCRETPKLFRDLPALSWNALGSQNEVQTRVRMEEPLQDGQDTLFQGFFDID